MDPAGSDDGWVMGRVGRVTAIGSACIAGYDAAGDMTCRAPSSATTCSGTWTGAQLTYDNAGRLAAWQNAPSNPTSTTANLYDGAGHLVEQQVTTGPPGAPVTTTTVYVGNVEEVATSGSTTTTTTYYYAGGARIALAINGVVSYLASDALGSLSLALAASGAVEAAQLFDPYGNVRYSTGTMPGSYGFAGQHADSTTGLDYFNARYYDPAAGQFVTADTTLSGGGMDPWALARYAYVEGNPLIRLDPSGHDWFGSLVSSVAHVVQAAAPAAIAVLDATTGIPSMIGDVHTIFFSNASPLDKVMAGADLLLNVGMDAAMVVGVGEGLRVAYVGVHVAEHMAEDVGAHAIEHAGEDAVAHTVEHEAESEAEHAGEQAAEDGAEAGGCLSFAAGTLVATPTGETPIAALKAGDHVTAYDPATGTASTQTVTATSIHHDDNLVDLTLRVSGPATPAAVSSATASRATPAPQATPTPQVTATTGTAATHATPATTATTV